MNDGKNGKNWLDGIGIASPCSANWNEMKGDDRSRFCSQCSLHVFDLSAMTRNQAEELVASKTGGGTKGRLCVRFTRRADGTVLTQDCPVGLSQKLRRAAARVTAACAAMLAFVSCRKVDSSNTLPETPPVEHVPLQGDVLVEPLPLQGEMVAPHMGLVAPPDHTTMGRVRAPDDKSNDK